MERLGGKVIGATLIELEFFEGRRLIEGYEFFSLVRYSTGSGLKPSPRRNTPSWSSSRSPRDPGTSTSLDYETGRIRLDRMLFSFVHYPTDYGFVPDTLAEDGDPDAMVLLGEPTFPGCRSRPASSACSTWPTTRARPEAAGRPADRPHWNHIYRLEQVAPHMLREIEHFFTVYKQLERTRRWRPTAGAMPRPAATSWPRPWSGRCATGRLATARSTGFSRRQDAPEQAGRRRTTNGWGQERWRSSIRRRSRRLALEREPQPGAAVAGGNGTAAEAVTLAL